MEKTIIKKIINERYRFQLQHHHDHPQPCPRCGAALASELAANAFSRREPVYICSDCGVKEALEDWKRNPLPIENWDIFRGNEI